MPDPKTSRFRQLQAIVDELILLEEMYLKGNETLEAGVQMFHDIWKHLPGIRKWAKKNLHRDPKLAKLFVQVTNYGKYYLDLEGNPWENLQLYKESLHVARRCQDREMEAIHLSFVGEVYDAVGKSRTAIKYHHQALQIADAIDDEIIKGIALYGLCWSCYYVNDYDHALEYSHRSLAISQQLGIPREISHDLSMMGLIYSEIGETDRAIETLQEALAIDRAEGDGIAEGATMGCLAEAFLRKGKLSEAKENILGAIAIERKLQDTPNLIDHLLVLGEIYLEEGFLNKAITTVDESLELSVRTEREEEEANAIELLSRIFYEVGDMERAIIHLRSAIHLYDKTYPKQARILNNKLLSWHMGI